MLYHENNRCTAFKDDEAGKHFLLYLGYQPSKRAEVHMRHTEHVDVASASKLVAFKVSFVSGFLNLPRGYWT